MGGDKKSQTKDQMTVRSCGLQDASHFPCKQRLGIGTAENPLELHNTLYRETPRLIYYFISQNSI